MFPFPQIPSDEHVRELQTWGRNRICVFGDVDDFVKAFPEYANGLKEYPEGFGKNNSFDYFVDASLQKVGYKCPDCEKFVTGAPLLSSSQPDEQGRGIESLNFYCQNCNSLMHERIMRYSD